MRSSIFREMMITAILSLTMSASLSYGAVLAIDHLLGPSDEAEIAYPLSTLIDSD